MSEFLKKPLKISEEISSKIMENLSESLQGFLKATQIEFLKHSVEKHYVRILRAGLPNVSGPRLHFVRPAKSLKSFLISGHFAALPKLKLKQSKANYYNIRIFNLNIFYLIL